MNPSKEEILKAERAIAQKKASDKALLKAGVRPKLRIVRRDESKFSSAFDKALEEYRNKPKCSKCNHDKPKEGGPYCNCDFGQSWLKTHQRWIAEEKVRQQQRQAERRKELTKKLQKAGGFVIPKRYKNLTPRTLQILIGDDEWYAKTYETLRKAVSMVIAWTDNESQKSSVLLSGEFGTGKTALCFWAARRRTKQTGEMPLLIRYRQFIDLVQDCYRKNSENRKLDFIAGAQQAEILLLDDFGHINLPLGTEAHPDKQEIMLEVLDYRTQHDLPTLIVTNLTQSQLMAQFNGAITGRLMELCQWVEMGGKNLREKGAVGWQT